MWKCKFIRAGAHFMIVFFQRLVLYMYFACGTLHYWNENYIYVDYTVDLFSITDDLWFYHFHVFCCLSSAHFYDLSLFFFQAISEYIRLYITFYWPYMWGPRRCVPSQGTLVQNKRYSRIHCKFTQEQKVTLIFSLHVQLELNKWNGWVGG